MRTSKLFLLVPVVAALAGVGAPPAGAEGKHASNLETVRSGNTGGACGFDLCAEVWKFQCAASTTLHADVTDSGSPFDDVLTVTLVGNAPASIKGKASIQITPPGGTTPSFAELKVANNTTISGFAVITVVSNTGTSAYDADLHCHKKDFTIVNPGTITLIQNE